MRDPLSFQRDYIPVSFPIEGHYFHLEKQPSRSSSIIHSAQELEAFQEELRRQEQDGLWIFIAYYPLFR